MWGVLVAGAAQAIARAEAAPVPPAPPPWVRTVVYPRRLPRMRDTPVYLICGQSNAVGGAHVDDLQTPSLATPDAAVPIARWAECDTYGSACGIETTWEALQCRAPVGGGDRIRFGVELTLGRGLARYHPRGVRLVQHATSGTTLATDWDPAAASGLRLYARARDVLRALAPAHRVRGIVWIQANGDANTQANADAYGARLRALCDAWRTDFGDQVRVVFDQLSPYATNTYRDTVRAQQAAVAADPAYSPWVRMIATENMSLRDGTAHYDAQSFEDLGWAMATALVDAGA